MVDFSLFNKEALTLLILVCLSIKCTHTHVHTHTAEMQLVCGFCATNISSFQLTIVKRTDQFCSLGGKGLMRPLKKTRMIFQNAWVRKEKSCDGINTCYWMGVIFIYQYFFSLYSKNLQVSPVFRRKTFLRPSKDIIFKYAHANVLYEQCFNVKI